MPFNNTNNPDDEEYGSEDDWIEDVPARRKKFSTIFIVLSVLFIPFGLAYSFAVIDPG